MPTGSPLLSFGSFWHLPEYKSQASKSSACGRFSDLGLWAQIGPSEHGGSRQVGGRLGPLVVTVRPVGTLLWQPSRVKHSCRIPMRTRIEARGFDAHLMFCEQRF
jgi:hypothetical protein